MDGTLFDSMAATTSSFIGAVARGGARPSADEVIALFSLGPPRRILDRLLGRPATDDDLMRYHELLSAGQVVVYDGVEEALERLRRAGVALGLFTGADVASLETLLGATALLSLFDGVVGGDEVAHPKPAPDGVLLACHRLGVAPEAAAYVGDTSADMQAARRAGVVAVGAGWGHFWASGNGADVVADTPSALPDVLGVTD